MLEGHPDYQFNQEGAERQANYVLKCLHGMEYNGKVAVEIFRESKNYQHIIHEWNDIKGEDLKGENENPILLEEIEEENLN